MSPLSLSRSRIFIYLIIFFKSVLENSNSSLLIKSVVRLLFMVDKLMKLKKKIMIIIKIQLHSLGPKPPSRDLKSSTNSLALVII